MKLIVGDPESIRIRDEKKYKSEPIAFKYLSNCCKYRVKQVCDWERPKGGHPGVTLITTCLNCNKECWVEIIKIYE